MRFMRVKVYKYTRSVTIQVHLHAKRVKIHEQISYGYGIIKRNMHGLVIKLREELQSCACNQNYRYTSEVTYVCLFLNNTKKTHEHRRVKGKYMCLFLIHVTYTWVSSTTWVIHYWFASFLVVMRVNTQCRLSTYAFTLRDWFASFSVVIRVNTQCRLNTHAFTLRDYLSLCA